MPIQTKLLTESGVSFAVFQHWVLNPNCKASDWIALLNLRSKGMWSWSRTEFGLLAKARS